ncbi:MAG TPA: hypothetical protein VIY53_18340 [Acidobacteriaceae bacterium]
MKLRMFRSGLPILIVLLSIAPGARSQITRTSVPLGDAVSKALEKSSLTGANARPFHIRIAVSEPENSQSPYQGTIEEWWASSDQWRREVTSKGGTRQTIVVAAGNKTERDEGDYFPLWLREFVWAAFDPVPDAQAWTAAGMTIDQITLPDGRKSDACARLQGKIGIGEGATDAFWNVCFQGDGLLKFVGSPRYSMGFHDYRGFGKKQVARQFVNDPEPGTRLQGSVTILEDESKVKDSDNLFAPLSTDDSRFSTIPVNAQQMAALIQDNPPIQWPPVRSGNTHGKLAMYISVDDKGDVREAWPLNSDNAGLEDPARDLVLKWKLKPAVDHDGKPVQVDGGLGFAFDTKIGDPLPVLNGADIAKAVSGCLYNPVLPAGLMPSGRSFAIRASVNEQGKFTGETYPGGMSVEVVQKAGLDLHNCRFSPWLVDGKPTYYFIDFVFTAP